MNPTLCEIHLLPQELEQDSLIRQTLAEKLGLPTEAISDYVLKLRSLDARAKPIRFLLRYEVYTQGTKAPLEQPILDTWGILPAQAPRVLVIGAGPGGYFAALELLEQGLKPIVLDRGKDVRSRRRDLRAIQQFGEVNPDSNYCYGEGGAGTYSDGKLYTRSHKRGSIDKVLRLLVEHGAKADILVDAHPHIGSNKLPDVISRIRQTILERGGEVHFEQRVTDFILSNSPSGQKRLEGVVVNEGQTEYRAEALILATGHSARDIFRLLAQRQIRIEAKPFALGVRIEHPQSLIDELQYRLKERPAELPASSYSLVCQVKERGVFSFCMCPGGLIVPAATSPGELVVNGMSMSRRDSPFANSGLVTAIELSDLKAYEAAGVFAGLEFQAQTEQKLFAAGDGSQKAPAQRLEDFVKGRLSKDLPKTSYIPGVYPARLDQLLPRFVAQRLQAALPQFGQQKKGYYSNEAQVVGVESRTSSPIRIPRERDTFMHPEVLGLFPCGEGAGYAGGIVSAAMDGQNVAKAVAQFLR